MPSISIIVPVYKSEAYLQGCIKSILNQSFRDFELLLVDDGSPDRCDAICDEYAAIDGRVRVIHKENGGVSSARNAALDIATGSFIVFVDSDDTVSETYLEELMRWKEYDFVSAGFMQQNNQNIWHKQEFEESSATIESIRKMPSKFLGKDYFGAPWAKLLKRTLIEDNSIRFDTTIHSGEDTLFLISYLNCASTIKIAPFCGYMYHYYPTSLVHKTHKDLWQWRVTVEQAFCDFFSQANGQERIFILNREFDVLRGLVARYDQTDMSTMLSAIFEHPFFQDCIAQKTNHGTMDERCFIRFMKCGKYERYKQLQRYLDLLFRAKRRIKRIVCR